MTGTSERISPDQSRRHGRKRPHRGQPFLDSNVLVTVRQQDLPHARRVLREFGEVANCSLPNLLLLYVPEVRLFNVLLLYVPGVPLSLETLCQQAGHQPQVFECLGRVIPVVVNFTWYSAEESEGRGQGARGCSGILGRVERQELARANIPTQLEGSALDTRGSTQSWPVAAQGPGHGPHGPLDTLRRSRRNLGRGRRGQSRRCIAWDERGPEALPMHAAGLRTIACRTARYKQPDLVQWVPTPSRDLTEGQRP